MRTPRLFPRHLAIATALVAWLSMGSAQTCGFHDDVTLARGALNWTYPDALHVIGAIATNRAEDGLPAPDASGTVPVPIAQLRTMRALRALTFRMQQTVGQNELTFALVLVEPMLWSRFDITDGQLRATLHADGPQATDLVIVSGDRVIRAIAHGHLSMRDAQRRGLVRLYGDAAPAERFLAVYGDVGTDQVEAAVRIPPQSR